MCGIAGVVGLMGPEERRDTVDRMSARLAHRGPDDADVYQSEGVALGHRRLSILDLSAAGRQPMVFGDLALVLNGEIYNHEDLRRELADRNPVWRSRSDTETLLQAFHYWGDEVVHRLRGMFAFAIWDRARTRLVCARDPFGKKPLYYRQTPAGFVFASEVEAVVTALDKRPDPAPESLSSFLLRGHMPAGESIYAGISTLRAGHCLEYDGGAGTLRTWPYSQPKFVLGPRSVDDTEAVNHAGALLRSSVERRLLSDVPVGALLSGGVDSSLICLNTSKPLTAFTAGFPGTPADEMPYAALVAAEGGLPHVPISMTSPDFPTLLGQLARAFGEPFGDQSAIPAYGLFEGLKPHVKVALTGDGADETFAGYADARLFWWRDRFGAPRQSGRGFAKMSSLMVASQTRAVRTAGFGTAALAMAGDDLFVFLFREGWTAEWRRRYFRPEAWRALGEETPEASVRAAFGRAGETDFERYLNMNLERLTECFLVKIDRMSMTHSIEARCPFLDIDFAAWAMTLSADALAGRGRPKRLLKALLRRRTGASFANRRKVGFTPPLDRWLREEAVMRWVVTNLTDPRSFVASLIEPTMVRQLADHHAAGENHTGRLWRLLVLNAWQTHVCGTGPS